MVVIEQSNTLFEKLDRGLTGIRLYGIAPPKLASDPERLREERSIDLCESVFTDVHDYAREKHLPIGINVESVSIRKSEIDASVELYRRLTSRLGG